MKEWEQYEQQIFEKYKNKFDNCAVLKNIKKNGLSSKVPRQIDVLLNGTIADRNIEIVLECKCFNKKVNVKTIDSFIGFLEDVGIQYGTVITNKGFSDGAKNRAENSTNKNIKLDVVDFRNFEEYEFEPDISTCEACDDEYRNIIFWDGCLYSNEDFEIAYCEYCNEPHMRCKNCGEITPLIIDADNEGITECRGGCGLKVRYNEYNENDLIEIISKAR